MKAWRNRLIVIAIIAIGVMIYLWYIDSFDLYDFSHIGNRAYFGESSEFVPLEGQLPGGFVLAVENEYLALYVNPDDTTIAIEDKTNGHIWYSTPPETNQDPLANPWQRNLMRSSFDFRFFDESRRVHSRFAYTDSAAHEEQTFIYSIPNGIRINYIVGNLNIGIDAVPFVMEAERFQERIMAHIEDSSDRRFMQQWWRPHPDPELDGFVMMPQTIRDSAIHSSRMLSLFYDVAGYEFEELDDDLAAAGMELELEFDIFEFTLEYVLDRNTLIVNLPISEMQIFEGTRPFEINLLRFFGAGGPEDEGFILVPSGSGGVINFNNGKVREDPFAANVYGSLALINNVIPQSEQPVRLPVFGIKQNNAAFIAHIYRGSSLATINADVAARGGVNSYNNAWFTFTLLSSMPLTVGSIPGVIGDMTVVQHEHYLGDITVKYTFISDDEPGVGEMAAAYRNFLIEEGALSPINSPGDRSFYLDVIGAIDVRRHFLGVPFTTIDLMSDIDDAHMFVDMLNERNINTIQMQLHGWFNRGINHDAAKRVNIINSVGRRSDLIGLNDRLEQSNGGLFPAVNFMFTNWDSRRVNRRFETAKDPAGYMAFMSRVNRELLTTMFSMHWNDWYLMIHPGVLPMHVADFIPQYERRLGIDNLALTDLGSVVSESMFRRDPIDRQSARGLIIEQFEHIHSSIPNLMVSGGNDFSLAFASHIVDAPIEVDRFYVIDYEVPFYSMVLHGFIEFAGTPANTRDSYNPVTVLLNSMKSGASPRYTFTAEPTRRTQFSPYEYLHSTQYTNWIDIAAEHFRIFNEVYAPLRNVPMTEFHILDGGGASGTEGFNQVSVTVFENGTRIYVNKQSVPFDTGEFIIPAEWFVVKEG